MKKEKYNISLDGEIISCEEIRGIDDLGKCPWVLILHGAGNSNKLRYEPIMTDLAAVGINTLAFDFSGHGDSSGELCELSLRRRYIQARELLGRVVEKAGQGRIVVMGFSMSGQTVCDLLRSDGDALSGAVLCCPAVYTADAYDLEFGNSEFTQVIRMQGSWRKSSAFSALEQFRGKILVVRPRVDDVIPEEVSQRILESCPEGGLDEFLLPDAGHQLAQWFASNSVDRESLVTRVSRICEL